MAKKTEILILLETIQGGKGFRIKGFTVEGTGFRIKGFRAPE